MTFPGPEPPVVAAPVSRAAGRGWQVATVVLAAAVIVLAVLLARADTGSRSASGASVVASAQASARFACDLLAELPSDGFDIRDQRTLQDKLALAAQAAFLARDQDLAMRHLYDAIKAASDMVNLEFNATSSRFRQKLAAARNACARR